MAQSTIWSARGTTDAAQKETTLVTTQAEVKLPKPNTHEVQVPQGALVLIPLCFACVWAIAAKLSSLPKISRERNLSLKRHSKIPCRSCQFYSNNPYIRCAIRPTDALTEQAIDCSDYQLSNPQKSSR